MVYEAKMKENEQNVLEFIERIERERKREDSLQLLEIFEKVSGYPAKMWGASIIGFGKYDYQYKSGHSGSAPLTGFAPGKGHKISLYLLIPYTNEMAPFMEKLGKFTHGKSCLYINKLSDIDIGVLKEMIKFNINYLKEKYPATK
ncbi:DUF1801 domain-containing protein [Facklamia sp. DSM 111018]|uniref:DUF1801 domain-containing protein n=1 Tax=Facklamia lactis TaxID=2749967 RepID=A0ABS0LPI0_9LACT|nr:DUF1801 domain-containing protein [Facklamia lactis]MBG9979910.1 DUF1801 domain-containing protein [Facklamia lactis]MBG9985410.1 DUF1801 domain-containing protein [Facklamia lactis]